MIEQKMIFLYPKTELEQIEVLKKHIARIQKNENLPVVLVLKELSFRQKEYLIREKIPFIVDGKQIYLPFMAVYLQERCSAEKKTREEILPSAQMLLLHFIYGGAHAIVPKTRGQEDKIAQGLARMNEEDPTFSVTNNAETHQMVLNGSGDMQVDVLVSKLKSRFNVEADLKPVRVPYREKIRKTVQKQGRHKKQTGGSGQFGDVWIRFEPQTEQDDMIFAEEVFGGSVPKNFFPAVEKGLREACAHGPLAGYPVVNLKAVLYDGSYHPVDSSEIAFKTAAQLAYKAALPEANPVLLEPVGELKVTVPDSYMGDVIGDLNKRRGRVMGMDPTGDGNQVISAEVPMAEMGSYAIDLRSMTQSRGSFTFHFVRYEDCPPAAQEKAIAEAKALQAAEEK